MTENTNSQVSTATVNSNDNTSTLPAIGTLTGSSTPAIDNAPTSTATTGATNNGGAVPTYSAEELLMAFQQQNQVTASQSETNASNILQSLAAKQCDSNQQILPSVETLTSGTASTLQNTEGSATALNMKALELAAAAGISPSALVATLTGNNSDSPSTPQTSLSDQQSQNTASILASLGSINPTSLTQPTPLPTTPQQSNSNQQLIGIQSPLMGFQQQPQGFISLSGITGVSTPNFSGIRLANAPGNAIQSQATQVAGQNMIGQQGQPQIQLYATPTGQLFAANLGLLQGTTGNTAVQNVTLQPGTFPAIQRPQILTLGNVIPQTQSVISTSENQIGSQSGTAIIGDTPNSSGQQQLQFASNPLIAAAAANSQLQTQLQSQLIAAAVSQRVQAAVAQQQAQQNAFATVIMQQALQPQLAGQVQSNDGIKLSSEQQAINTSTTPDPQQAAAHQLLNLANQQPTTQLVNEEKVPNITQILQNLGANQQQSGIQLQTNTDLQQPTSSGNSQELVSNEFVNSLRLKLENLENNKAKTMPQNVKSQEQLELDSSLQKMNDGQVDDSFNINETSETYVDGINLEDIKEFARMFKIRRLSLGLTQTQVGQALSAAEGPAYSQSAICRFEKLDITPKSAQRIKPVLERWLQEAEQRYRAGSENLTEFVGSEPSKKRKRRTSFTPAALELLNAYFEHNTHPSGAEMMKLAMELNYDREVIRVWFCNKRQALKNTIKKIKIDEAAASDPAVQNLLMNQMATSVKQEYPGEANVTGSGDNSLTTNNIILLQQQDSKASGMAALPPLSSINTNFNIASATMPQQQFITTTSTKPAAVVKMESLTTSAMLTSSSAGLISTSNNLSPVASYMASTNTGDKQLGLEDVQRIMSAVGQSQSQAMTSLSGIFQPTHQISSNQLATVASESSELHAETPIIVVTTGGLITKTNSASISSTDIQHSLTSMITGSNVDQFSISSAAPTTVLATTAELLNGNSIAQSNTDLSDKHIAITSSSFRFTDASNLFPSSTEMDDGGYDTAILRSDSESIGVSNASLTSTTVEPPISLSQTNTTLSKTNGEFISNDINTDILKKTSWEYDDHRGDVIDGKPSSSTTEVKHHNGEPSVTSDSENEKTLDSITAIASSC